jgi:hypothetical protein
LKDYKHIPEIIVKMKTKVKDGKPSYNCMIRVKLSLSHVTIVINLLINFTKEYYVIREAVIYFYVWYHTVSAYIKKGKLLKKIFLITKKFFRKVNSAKLIQIFSNIWKLFSYIIY